MRHLKHVVCGIPLLAVATALGMGMGMGMVYLTEFAWFQWVLGGLLGLYIAYCAGCSIVEGR